MLIRSPERGRPPWIDACPARVALAALTAAAIGVAVDWSQFGQFPILATAQAPNSSAAGWDYLVYLPDGYALSKRSWPVIFFLHGSGSVGRDIARVRRESLPRRLEELERLPFIVVAPQSPGGGWDVEVLDTLVEEVLAMYRADPARVYLTGQSMGGYGAWALAAAHPNRFAAVAPLCGGGDIGTVQRLRGLPIWAFHGSDDTVVPLEESRKMVSAIERIGGTARLTIYPGVGHDVGGLVYADPELYSWFFQHTRRASRP